MQPDVLARLLQGLKGQIILSLVPRRPIFYGWWVVLGCAIISLWAGGLFYGFTAFVNPIVAEFGWTYLTVSLAASLRSVEMGLLGPVTGFFSDRLGPRSVVALCGLVSGAGLLLLSRTGSLAMFYAGFVVLSIGFSGLGQVVTTTAVANWFRKKVGRATGLAIAGYRAGGLLLPLMVWLIAQHGWRMTLAILGFATWLVILPALLLLRHRPEQYRYLPDGESPDVRETAQSRANAYLAEVESTASQALKTRAFWFLVLAFAIQFMVLNAVTLHVMPYFADLGFSEELAALVAMFIPLASVAGRLSLGWLGDVFDKRFVMATTFFLQALGLTFFCYDGRALWQFVIFLAFFSPAFGGALALRSAMLREYFGRRAFGSIQGLMIVVVTLGGIIGPAFAGWVFDVRGSYQLAWLSFAAITLAVVPLMLAIGKGGRGQE